MSSFEELTTMRQEWVEVTRKNGFREGIADLLAHQYSKKTHFIFELLQNADDAEAEEAAFRLEDDKLVFTHNGKKLFNAENIESITSIGKSAKEFTDIGKHGIGFKSVFAFTHTPRIHSGENHFDIIDVVVPIAVSRNEIPEDIKPDETRILLPFDTIDIPDHKRFRKLISADEAVIDISSELKNLNARILTFLRHLKEIRWDVPDGSKGILLRDLPKKITENAHYVNIADDNNKESWIVFNRRTQINDENKQHEVIVEVAFLIQDGKMRKAPDTELVVYFPTEKETGLGFLIHGPFKTTKARDNIAQDNDANKRLIETAAQLAADSLENLRDLGLLQVESFNALPLRSSDFPDNSFFRPVYDAIRATLRTKPLLPREGGGYVAAIQARLARGAQLTEVFPPVQLGSLFGKEKLHWLDTAITAERMPNLHAYLTGRKKSGWKQPEWEQPPLKRLGIEGGIELGAEKIAGKITTAFMSEQSDQWLISFYRYLSESGHRQFINRPIIRLEGDDHVVPFGEDGSPNAFLPADDEDEATFNGLPMVKRSLLQYEDIHQFLEDCLGFTAPDIADFVLQKVLPKYSNGGGEIPPLRWRLDFRKILKALQTDSYESRERLRLALKSAEFLLVIKVDDPTQTYFAKAENTYRNTEEIKLFFSGCEHVYMLAPGKYQEDDIKVLIDLGLSESPQVVKRTPNCQGHVKIRKRHGLHQRGIDGFDPEWQMAGLENALTSPTIEQSRLLWTYLLPHSQCIRGVIETSSRQTFENSEREFKTSNSGRLLMDTTWLPDKQGAFHTPNSLCLEDLPDGFIKYPLVPDVWLKNFA